TFDTVWKLGLEMPEVEKTTTYGASALKLRGQLLACVAINKSAEPNTLMLRIDFDQRDGLLAEDPATYYVTNHYVNYPAVLVRLNCIQQDTLRDLLNGAWRFVMSKTKEKRPTRKRTVVVGRK